MSLLRNYLAYGFLGAVFLVVSTLAAAQQPPASSGIGVVTAVQGQATVSRQSLPAGSALHFKEDVFFRDEIATKERSTVRLLLGGKGVLTVREQSQVTLDETVAPDGDRRSVLGLLVGKIGAAIARTLMRPGEEVEIRTPNAVAAVRGTVLIVEFIPPKQNAEAPKPILLASSAPGPMLAQASGGGGGTSNIVVLSGSVTVTPLGQPPVTVGAMQSLTITATPGGIQVGVVQTITSAQAAQAAQGLEMTKPHTGEAAGGANVLAQTEIAAALASNLVTTLIGETPPAPAAPPVAPPALLPPVNRSECGGQSGCPPSSGGTTPPGGGGGTTPPGDGGGGTTPTANVLPIGPLLSRDTTPLNMSGAPVAEFKSGPANTIVPLGSDASLPNPATSPILPVTGNPISHSGTLISLTDSLFSGFDPTAGSGFDSPLVRIAGTSLTNTDGPLFSMSGNSQLSTLGPLLSLESGGSATLAGLLDMTPNTSSETSPIAALISANAVSVPSGTSLTATAPLFTLTGNSGLIDISGASASPGTSPPPSTSSPPVGTRAGAGPGGDGLLSVSGSLTLTGNGALLSATDNSVVVVGNSLLAASGGTITMSGTGPAVQLSNSVLSLSTLSSGGSLISLGNGAKLSASGPALDAANDSTIFIGTTLVGGQVGGGPIFALRGGSHVTWTGGPLIRLNNSTLLADGGFGDSDGAGNVVNISGIPGAKAVLLDATDSDVTFGGNRIPNVDSTNPDETTFSAPAGVPMIRLTGVSGRTTYSDSNPNSELVPHSDGTSTFDGLFLVASNSDITLAGRMLDVCCFDHLTTATTAPLLQLTSTNVTSGTNLLEINSGAPGSTSLTLAGPLLSDDSSTFNVTNNFLRLSDGGSLTSTSPNPLISLSGTTFIGGTGTGTNTGGSLLRMFSAVGQIGNSLRLRGSLLSAVGGTFTTTDSSFVNVRDGASLTTSLTSAPLLSLTGSSVTGNSVLADDNVIRFGPDGTDSLGNPGSQGPVTVSLSGPLLHATDMGFKATSASFLGLRNQTTFTGIGGGPLISLNGIAVERSGVSTPSGNFLFLAAAPGITPPSMSLTNPTGSLLDATNTSINSGTPDANDHTFLFVGDGATLSSAGTGPLTTFTNSSLTSAGNFLTIRRSGTGTSTVNLSGALLSAASNSTFTTFNSVTAGGCCSFLFVGEGGKLQGSGLDALLQSSNSSFPNIGGNFVNVTPTANLADSTPGPSSITLSGPLMDDVGSSFTIAGSLLRVADGSTLSSTTSLPLMKFSGSTINAGSLLFLKGVTTAGLGTQEVLKTSGPIFELSGAIDAGTTVNLTGTGNAIRVDTALLNASAPIINLINSALNTSATGAATGAMHMFQSSVTSNGPVMGLNNSTLQVNNGPALSLTGGSQMTVNGDLARLFNGAKVIVQNGPMILVDGPNSLLNVTGALVNFGGTGGNQIIINNSIIPNQNPRSIPSFVGPGSSVTIGPNPIKNPNLGTISINPSTESPGSVIRAINGGVVRIVAP